MERGREATIVDSTVPAATLRRPHDSGQACSLGWLLGWRRRRRRGSCEAKGHDTGSRATTTARRAQQQQQQGRCLAVSEEQRCDTRVRRTAFEQLLPPLCANRLGSGGMMALGRRDASAELGPRRPRPSGPHNHRISHRATETRCSGGGLHANNPANTPISPRVGCASVCERQHDGLLLGQAVASAQHGHIELSLKHAHCLLHGSIHRRACCCVASTPRT